MLTLVDYHVHLLGHLDVENPAERLNDFIKTAIRRGVSEIGFSDHDRYVDQSDFYAFARAQKAFPQIVVRSGLEFDFAPERAILEKCFEMGIPVTLGSDAHAPENAGRDLVHAADLARSVGYTSLATFSRRRMVSKTI